MSTEFDNQIERALGRGTWTAGQLGVRGVDAGGALIESEEGPSVIDLTSNEGAALLPFGDERVARALTKRYAGEAVPGEQARLRELLIDLIPGARSAQLLGSHDRARKLAVELALARGGRGEKRGRVLWLGPGAPWNPDVVSVSLEEQGGFRRALSELGDRPAGIIVAPLVPEPLSLEELREIRDYARDCGAIFVLDESDTLFRLAPRSVGELAELRPDLTLLGESLSAGLPFGALVSGLDLASQVADAGEACWLDGRAVAAARETVEALTAEPIHGDLVAAGEVLRQTFREAAEREVLHARLTGPAARLELRFDGQERAESGLMLRTFLEELLRQEVLAGPVVRPSFALRGEVLQRAARAIDLSLMRIRALLVEFNSYLSGGMPFVFPDADPVIAERGLAVYRYPADAQVSVRPEGESVEIRFAPAELGMVVSSGMYAPTRIDGDFRASVRYRLLEWKPGADAACLALFVQDEPSLVRYYAQRTSTGEAGEHQVLASFCGELGPGRPVTGEEGEFRLTRVGKRVTAWHRSLPATPASDWEILKEEERAECPVFYVGVKIWAKADCGGLAARLTDLRIQADIPADQPPPVPVRPDPLSTESGPNHHDSPGR